MEPALSRPWPSFAHPQRPKTFPGSFDQALEARAICDSRLPFARPQRPKTLRGSFEEACRRHPSATIGVRSCRLPALKGLKPSAAASTGSFDQALRPQPSATIGVRGCRLPALKGLKRSAAASTKDQALRPQPSATIGGCRLPALKGLKRSAGPSTRHAGQSHLLLFARPQNLKRSAAASTSSGHSHLLLSGFEAAVCDQALRPQPSATIGVRGCRLPALKGLKRSAAASTRHSGHSHLLLSGFEATVCPPSKAQNAPRQLRPGTQATAICYYRRSRLPFAHPQRPKTFRGSFDQALEATAICYYRRSRLPFAGPQRPKALRGTFDQALSYFGHNHLFFGVCKDQAPATAIYF